MYAGIGTVGSKGLFIIVRDTVVRAFWILVLSYSNNMEDAIDGGREKDKNRDDG